MEILNMLDIAKKHVTPRPSFKQEVALARNIRLDAEVWIAGTARNAVKCLGQKLSRPVYWRGTQWAVTCYGLECRKRKIRH